MEYLGDIREKAIKGLEIQVNLQDINENLIDELQKLGEEFPGNCVIKLNIYNTAFIVLIYNINSLNCTRRKRWNSSAKFLQFPHLFSIIFYVLKA